MGKTLEQGRPIEAEPGEAAIYDGLDLFEKDLFRHRRSSYQDMLTRIITPQCKAFGEQDGRHKRP